MVYDLDELTQVVAGTATAVTVTPVLENTVPPVHKSNYWHSLGARLVISLALCAIILTLPYWWPQAADFLRAQTSDEIGPIQSAAQTLVTDILDGEPIPEAIAVFCQEMADAQN